MIAHVQKLAALASLVTLLTACGGSSQPTTPATQTGGARDRWGISWLCRPGERDNPCISNLTTTAVQPGGRRRISHLRPSPNPHIDCFYVYPTISGQQRINANLAIDLRLREVALAQAAPFSRVCHVYAPVYRQITLSALEHPARITRAHALVAYDSVLQAFKVYLTHYNHGRGIVLIGHSQGAAILDRLIATQIDGDPPLRKRLVSALLLGGNVTNGDFAHISACRSVREAGCFVAYSSFTAKPSVQSEFGRTTSDAGVGLLARRPAPDTRVVCVNPASPSGGQATLHPALPSLVLAFLAGKGMPSVSTPWVTFPGWYRARCESSGNANWLQITPSSPSAGSALARLEEPALGLHILDVNIALGDLVRLVRNEARAYRR